MVDRGNESALIWLRGKSEELLLICASSGKEFDNQANIILNGVEN
jgi:hypothetical protein